MINLQELGWSAETVGELDHRLLKAPSIKLRSARSGDHGDAIYCVDLRIRHPNANACLSAAELHSIEHFLLEGFQRYLPANFVSVGVMGCQTGFYLVLLNEGRAEKVCQILENILTDMQSAAAVPYASVEQCGNYRNHSLEIAQKIGREMLEAKSTWMQAL